MHRNPNHGIAVYNRIIQFEKEDTWGHTSRIIRRVLATLDCDVMSYINIILLTNNDYKLTNGAF